MPLVLSPESSINRLRQKSSLSRQRSTRPPNGIALPAALLLILLIAALIAGVFSAVTEETRIGAAAADRQLSLLTAESAVEMTISAWSASPDDSISIGETTARSVEGLGLPVTVYLTRLDSSRYWLVGDAGSASPNSGIARRVGIVVTAKQRADRSMAIDRISERAWSELF
jgi:Tfp pilus assembly protein PilX